MSHQGFTLVEALIALFIFSWLSLAAYQMLDQVILTQATNKKASDALALNQRVNRQMAKDFRYMVDRPIIDEKGFQQPSLVLEGRRVRLLLLDEDGRIRWAGAEVIYSVLSISSTIILKSMMIQVLSTMMSAYS